MRLGTAPVATSTPSGVSPATASAVASVPSRTSTPAFRSCTSRSRVIQPNSSRPGVRRIRLTCPPSASSRSSSVTEWPRRASVTAAFIPAGPPPATTQRAGSSAATSGRSRPSRPAAGLTVQLIGRPLNTRPMQPWLPRMQWTTSSSRPSCTLFANSGSAIWARVIATMSALPEARISSASAGSLIPPTVNTGSSETAAFTCAVRSTRYPSGSSEGWIARKMLW